MKCKNLTPKQFESIRLEITIESAEELTVLFKRLNALMIDVEESSTNDNKDFTYYNNVKLSILYQIIRAEMMKHQLVDKTYASVK